MRAMPILTLLAAAACCLSAGCDREPGDANYDPELDGRQVQIYQAEPDYDLVLTPQRRRALREEAEAIARQGAPTGPTGPGPAPTSPDAGPTSPDAEPVGPGFGAPTRPDAGPMGPGFGGPTSPDAEPSGPDDEPAGPGFGQPDQAPPAPDTTTDDGDDEDIEGPGS